MKRIFWSGQILTSPLLVLFFLCLSRLNSPAAETNAAPEIVLGMSTVLSGPASNLGRDTQLGIRAGLERANRAGGVRGRKLRLITLDDGYEPIRTAPNMRQLIEKENVLAVIGNVGTPTGVAAIPIAIERKTLFFAPLTGAGVLRRNPPDRYVINYRASYAEETGAIIDALIEGCGFKVEDIALFTQKDAYGDAGYAGSITALKRHGLKNESQVLHVRYERNTVAVEDALASLLVAAHQPRAIIMVGTYGPCAKFIKLADEAGLKAIFHNVSFVGSRSLATELGNTPARVLISQVVPHPLNTDVRIVQDYHEDLKTIPDADRTSYCTLEGYVAARILLLALENIPGPITRESVVDALEALGEFDLGLGENLKLTPQEHQACHRVWLTRVQNGNCVSFPWSGISEWMGKE
jgi:branched-chain amino acid transport system substrate-binding protein